MKEQKFNSYEDFKKEVENLKKKHEYFFADAIEEIIYTREKNENFLSFYLNVLVKIVAYNNDELTGYNTTKWYFYISKSFEVYSKKDLDIMLEKLGYNFDNFDDEITDKIGVIY